MATTGVTEYVEIPKYKLNAAAGSQPTEAPSCRWLVLGWIKKTVDRSGLNRKVDAVVPILTSAPATKKSLPDTPVALIEQLDGNTEKLLITMLQGLRSDGRYRVDETRSALEQCALLRRSGVERIPRGVDGEYDYGNVTTVQAG